MIRQFGVIPYIKKSGALKVVLITSASGSWIFPKGNLEEHLGKRGTAELEALEEAGVKGAVDPDKSYKAVVMIRGGKESNLALYPMKVDQIRDKWPEEQRRQRKVVHTADAHRLISSDALRKCLDDFVRDFA